MQMGLEEEKVEEPLLLATSFSPTRSGLVKSSMFRSVINSMPCEGLRSTIVYIYFYLIGFFPSSFPVGQLSCKRLFQALHKKS